MESIQEYKGKYRWHPIDMVNDLVEKGGLKDCDIEVTRDMKLKYREIHFKVYHEYKQGMILESTKDLTELVQAFSKVLELKPFCKYEIAVNKTTYIIYEWQRMNQIMRYFDLMEDERIKKLEEIK